MERLYRLCQNQTTRVLIKSCLTTQMPGKTSSLLQDTWAEQGGGRQLSVNSLCYRIGASIKVKDTLYSWNISSSWPPLKPGNIATLAPPSLAVPSSGWPPPRHGATNSHFWVKKKGGKRRGPETWKGQVSLPRLKSTSVVELAFEHRSVCFLRQC